MSNENPATRMIANEQANIRRIDREIEDPQVYSYHTVMLRGRERWDTSLPSEPLYSEADLAERIRSLREERKHHEKTIEKIQKEFRLNERESNVK